MAEKFQKLMLRLMWQRRKRALETHLEDLVRRLKGEILAHRTQESIALFTSILDLSELHWIASELCDGKDGKQLIYIMPTFFLMDAFDYLKQQEEESLHFVTGVELGNIVILDRIVKLVLEKQSVVFAKANPRSVQKALIELTKYGYKLFAYFHIHPGNGKEATYPSHIDMRLDKLLQRGNYNAIGAIFSRDGFVRFFTEGKYKIEIFGKGVSKIDDRTFEITQALRSMQI